MMTNEAIEALLTRMCEQLPALMDAKGYRRDTCILHTRIAVDALRGAGLRARPLAVQLAVFNHAWVGWASALGRMPNNVDPRPDGAWAVHVGYGAPDDSGRPGYDGHVLAVVNERYALDLTIDQTSRPQKNIIVRPHWWIMDDGFTAGGKVHAFRVQAGDTWTYVRYEAMPEDRDYLKAGDWRLPGKRVSSTILPTQAELAAITR